MSGGLTLTYDPNTNGGFEALDRVGRVIDQKWQTDANTPTVKDRFRYGYDRNSNRTYRQNNVGTAKDELYTYDGLNRLTKSQRGTLSTNPPSISSSNREEDFTLDQVGNWRTYLAKNLDANGNLNTQWDQDRSVDKANEITGMTQRTGTWAQPPGRESMLPFPVANLRHVLSVSADILLVLDELVLDLLLEVRALGAQPRQAVNHVLHQMEAVQVIEPCRAGEHARGIIRGQLPVVREEFFQLVGGVVADAGDHVAETGEGVQAVAFGRGNQASARRRCACLSRRVAFPRSCLVFGATLKRNEVKLGGAALGRRLQPGRRRVPTLLNLVPLRPWESPMVRGHRLSLSGRRSPPAKCQPLRRGGNDHESNDPKGNDHEGKDPQETTAIKATTAKAGCRAKP